MTLRLETLPNEVFLHGIFSYLSLIDLNYAFQMLNQRFNRLVSIYLAKRVHHIHLTNEMKCHKIAFTIDHVLPYLTNNQHLRTLEVSDCDLFLKFLEDTNRINTRFLNTIKVTPFIDIRFDVIIKLLSKCTQLNTIKLNVLTSSDASWANGRKWSRWFDTLLRNNRDQTLKSLDICIWCINTNDAINFDCRLWNREGIYNNNENWKVQLKPDQGLNWRQSRRSVEFSRCDQDYLALLDDQKNSTCTPS